MVYIVEDAYMYERSTLVVVTDTHELAEEFVQDYIRKNYSYQEQFDLEWAEEGTCPDRVMLINAQHVETATSLVPINPDYQYQPKEAV